MLCKYGAIVSVNDLTLPFNSDQTLDRANKASKTLNPDKEMCINYTTLVNKLLSFIDL